MCGRAPPSGGAKGTARPSKDGSSRTGGCDDELHAGRPDQEKVGRAPGGGVEKVASREEAGWGPHEANNPGQSRGISWLADAKADRMMERGEGTEKGARAPTRASLVQSRSHDEQEQRWQGGKLPIDRDGTQTK